jgi:adenylate cyclase
MPHDVFVSHSSKDKATADAVVAMLEARGIRCWVAPRDISPGADWSESILNAIYSTQLMVLIFSSNANASPQIKREVERAVYRGKPVIPLRIEDVAPTRALEYFISTPHWLDAFAPPLEKHLQYLADVVTRILEAPDEVTESTNISDFAKPPAARDAAPGTTAAPVQDARPIARPVRAERPEFGDLGPAPHAPALALPDKPSIAVMPFQNMSGDPEQDFFCDGMVEDIITGLSRFPWLFVIARNSSFTYKGKAVDIKQVGRDLGVRYVLEGSVRKAGNRVRITGQLIEATTSAHLWAERYERSLDDIFAVQDEIVAAIVGTLVPEIGAAEGARSLRKPPQSLDAWDVYQRGLQRYTKFGKEDIAESRKMFDRAIELDPTFPDPYVFRALTGIAIILFGYADSERDVLTEATGYVQRAVQLDERNALAHTILGRSLMLAGKLDASIAENRLGIELNANLALAHFGLGAALLWSGKADQSIPSFEQSLRLSPRDPISPLWRQLMSYALSFSGANEAGLAAVDMALRQRPDNSLVTAMRALPLVGLGRLDEARASVAEAVALNPSMSRPVVLLSFPHMHKPYVELALDRLRQAGLPD